MTHSWEPDLACSYHWYERAEGHTGQRLKGERGIHKPAQDIQEAERDPTLNSAHPSGKLFNIKGKWNDLIVIIAADKYHAERRKAEHEANEERI
jgi:hypothetical protein